MDMLLTALSAHAHRDPDGALVAVQETGEWHVLTAQFLLAELEGWARSFIAAGLPPGSVLFVVLPHGTRLYTVFLGAMRAGLVPSFLPVPTVKQDPGLYWQSHAALFARVDPGGIVTCREQLERVRAIADPGCRLFDVDQVDDADTPLAPLHDVESPTAIALLQHSSGTTGLKKGVALTFGQIARQVEVYSQAVSMTADDCVVSWLPLYHDMGLITGFLMPLSIGCRVVSIGAFDWLGRPDQLLHLIAQERATHCWLPNFAFNHLIRTRDKKGRYDLSSIRRFVSCSEPAQADTIDRFEAAFGDHGLRPDALAVCYAMAETVFAISQTREAGRPATVRLDGEELSRHSRVVAAGAASPTDMRVVSCGPLVDGIECRVDAAKNQDTGEVQVRGGFVFDGYYRNEEDTRASFTADGWYRTGDIGFFHQGELYLCGRSKEILIVHGRNYYATDIERIASGVPGIKPGRVVAFGIVDRNTASEEAVVLAEALAETADPADLESSIRRAVSDLLELSLRQMIIVPAGHIIKTSSGKVSRRENRRLYLERAGAAS